MTDILEDMPELRPYERGNLVSSPPPEESPQNIVSLLIDVDDGNTVVFYHVETSVNPDIIEFPRLLSRSFELRLSKEDLRDEILLLLRSQKLLYSLRVIEPCPFKITYELAKILENYSTSVIKNAEAGYIIHDDLYRLSENETALSILIDSFFKTCQVVEIKISQTPGESKIMRVLFSDSF